MADAAGISFGTHPSLLPTSAPPSSLDAGQLNLADALSRLGNVESLSEFNNLVSSLSVTARPGPYILYTGDFPDLPGADGSPTRTGTIANQIARQIGASIIDETPRAQFLADPTVVAKFTDLATQAGLDPAKAYSDQFFTNPDAYWRQASREFVGSTNGDGFAVTGSRTRANPIMVIDEIPTAMSTPGSNFLPAYEPSVAQAIATGNESAIRQAMADSTRNLINDGQLLRSPDDGFGITRDGLDRIGLGTTPEPVAMAADLRGVGYQPLVTAPPGGLNPAPIGDGAPPLPGSTHPTLGGIAQTSEALPDIPITDVPSISPARASTGAPESVGVEPALPGVTETTGAASDPLSGRAPTGLPELGAPEAPAEITGTATGRFTPNFVGVIGQSPTASKIFTGAGVLGAVGLAADAGMTGYNAYQLYNQGDTLGAGHEVAGFGGRLGGSLTGAYLLGEAGAFGGPWGALGGAIVGGIGGAILGDKGVKSLYDSLTGYQPPAAAAAPTPAWPDQFAAEFDRNNGGGPFSDPMTGFQTESQTDYDARRQAYVDSKMADQQAQGQQMLDTLKLTPSVDPNALPADPTTSPPPAAPTEPAPAAPLDTPPANTGSSAAPLNTTPDDINALAPTSISLDGSLSGLTTPASPPSPDTTGLSLGGGSNSGIDPTLGSFDTELNSNLGLSSNLNTGLTSGVTGNDPLGLNSGLDSGFNSGLNSSLSSGFDNSLNSGLNSSLNSGLDSSFNSGLNSGLSSGLDSSLNSGLDSGLGSSSSFSDFGDSSLGGDSFSSGSVGGDMGPVVLDLSGQGIRITDLNDSHAAFDADGNGVPNRIAWTAPDEGLLAFDANGSGTVDQTSELALREWTPGAQTDLQGLRAFDTNHDGALDAQDRDFGRFDIWRDSNGNGVSDRGELHSLVESGVSAISFASDGVQSHLPDGSTIYGQGSFTRTDGSSGRLADVALAYAPDINAARDQLVGAMAAAPGGSAGATAPPPSPVAIVGPMLGADAVSPLHARSP